MGHQTALQDVDPTRAPHEARRSVQAVIQGLARRHPVVIVLLGTDFKQAMTFVNGVADLAEAENHHPDIAVSYNRVVLRWSTHSAGGITGLDLELARRISGAAA